MADERTTGEAWREVGERFQALGEGLAQAFRAAWEDEENRRRLHDVRAGLEAMMEEIGQAVRETGASPEGQKVRGEAEKTVESARVAGKQAWQEARPHLIAVLRQVGDELQKMASRLEEE